MKIKAILSQHRFDFTADMECEHCGHAQRLNSGYDDSYYHQHVIPAMTCGACAKNRSGVIPTRPNDNGTLHVSPSSSDDGSSLLNTVIVTELIESAMDTSASFDSLPSVDTSSSDFSGGGGDFGGGGSSGDF